MKRNILVIRQAELSRPLTLTFNILRKLSLKIHGSLYCALVWLIFQLQCFNFFLIFRRNFHYRNSTLENNYIRGLKKKVSFFSKPIMLTTNYLFCKRLAQSTILSLMSRIDVGHLRVLSKDRIYEFGPKDSKLKSEIKIVNDSFWIRLLLLGDLVSKSFLKGF
jgi:hypothetical protein